MSQKTSSSTIVVGGWTCIFFNRPENNDIEYVRFTTPRNAQRGKIGTSAGSIVANEGAIDTVLQRNPTTGTDIVLYYISPDLVVKEIRLRNAERDEVDLKSGWIDSGEDMFFEKEVDGAVRQIDASSFMSATVKGNYPVLAFAPKGQAGTIRYCWYSDENGWANALLKF